jgi:hypothetical protein
VAELTADNKQKEVAIADLAGQLSNLQSEMHEK